MNIDTLFAVYEFAMRAHEGQKRKTGEPYITHPVAVAQIAINAEGDSDEIPIYACLLHDVVEDTSATLDDISARFGEEVAFLVDGVTKKGSPEETIAKVREYSDKDKRVIMIKLADRIHNTSTLEGLETIKEKYKKSNPFYIELGREKGYGGLSNVLHRLTGSIR